MQAIQVINDNYMGQNGSFVYHLHEDKIFKTDKYWLLYNSIRQVCLNKDSIDKKSLDKKIFDIHSYLLRATIWHLSPDDLSVIQGPQEGLGLYVERLNTLISASYFGESLLDEYSLNDEIKNPDHL